MQSDLNQIKMFPFSIVFIQQSIRDFLAFKKYENEYSVNKIFREFPVLKSLYSNPYQE
jgi:hypothetical protein